MLNGSASVCTLEVPGSNLAPHQHMVEAFHPVDGGGKTGGGGIPHTPYANVQGTTGQTGMHQGSPLSESRYPNIETAGKCTEIYV